jgi:hypothetical protein
MAKKSSFLVIFFFAFVWKSVKIFVCLPAGKYKPPVPVGDGFSGEPQVLVSADTHHKPLFGNQGKVLNLDHLNFDIVSTVRCPVENFVLRYSYFIRRTPSDKRRIRPLQL